MNLMAILYIMYGILIGAIVCSAIARRRMARRIRSKIVKLTETHTIAVTDFAGKEVSLERFCDKVLGPEAYYQKDPETRKHEMRNWIAAGLLLFFVTVAVLTAIYFN